MHFIGNFVFLHEKSAAKVIFLLVYNAKNAQTTRSITGVAGECCCGAI